MRALPEPYLGSSRFVADVLLLFPAFTIACLLLSGLELISLEHLHTSSLCSSIQNLLHCGAGLAIRAGPSPDMGLPGASGQGLPAQGMVYCSTVLEPFAYTA